MPKAKKQFVGAHVPKVHADALARVADENHRSTAAELRIAIEQYLVNVGALAVEVEAA